jgi:hypothetical protein
MALALREGLGAVQACAKVGIHFASHRLWLEKAETGMQPYASYADMIQRVQAERELESLVRIREAGIGGQMITKRTVRTTGTGDATVTIEEAATKPDWTADAWFLERRYPDRWGRKEPKIEVNFLLQAIEQEALARGLAPEVVLDGVYKMLLGSGEVER